MSFLFLIISENSFIMKKLKIFLFFIVIFYSVSKIANLIMNTEQNKQAEETTATAGTGMKRQHSDRLAGSDAVKRAKLDMQRKSTEKATGTRTAPVSLCLGKGEG